MSRITRTKTMLALVLAAGFALGASPVQAETFDISLDGIDFVYEGMSNTDIDLTIQVGDTIRWTWTSGFHNIASGFPPEPNGGSLFFSGDPVDAVGTTFEYTFTDTGVFGYHCEVHESLGMFSSVTVVPEPTSIALLLFGTCFSVSATRRRSISRA